MARARAELWTSHLGIVPYREGVELQERLRLARQSEAVGDLLLMLEHPPVYTLGRRSEPSDLPMGEDWCRAQGIDVVPTSRGGKLTYHGLGQLVGYPIMRTSDVLDFLRVMEHAIIAALADEGIEAGPRPGLTGVWVQDRKIASIGVHLSRGVTMHGFAVNVDNDLAPFSWVVPCGLDGVRMTSVAAETGRAGRLGCFRKAMAWRFAQAHGLRQRLVSPARLGVTAPALTAPVPA